MNMQGVRYGDLVLVDKKGRQFHAELRDRMDGGEWTIMPIMRTITYRTCKSNEVKKIWRASRRAVA